MNKMDKRDKIDKIDKEMKSIKNRKSKIVNFLLVALIGFNACGDWIDVVPDGVATLDMAFNSKAQALRYLGTCYSHMPKDATTTNPALLGSDELWAVSTVQYIRYGWSEAALDLIRGKQNATNPLLGRWNAMYQALRDCNTFLENVGSVPDLEKDER